MPECRTSQVKDCIRSESVPAMPALGFDLLRIAAQTLRGEILGFRFRCPWKTVPEAGPRESLEYYLYSDSLDWSDFSLDPSGVPRTWSRHTGAVYWAGDIAWYGLVNLGHYLRHREQQHLDIFLNQVDWLEEHAVLREDGAVVWQMDFDYPEVPLILKKPWISAHEQGRVISALVRGYRVTRRARLLELLRKSSKIFGLDVEFGGVRARKDGYVFYTEKPGTPSPGILDGFLVSLLGLYDLLVETGDTNVSQLFQDGISGLKHFLPLWDYRNKWSWYGNRGYLSSPCYHNLNRLQLASVARVSKERILMDYARQWDLDRLSLFDRLEIYAAFQLTKNACRLRNRTWRVFANSRAHTNSAV